MLEKRYPYVVVYICTILIFSFFLPNTYAEIKDFVKTDGRRFVNSKKPFIFNSNQTKQFYKPSYLDAQITLEKRIERPFYFNAANQYYLFYATDDMIDEIFADAQALGLNVMRIFGFCDGTPELGFDGQEYVFQSAPGVYGNAFERMDYIIAKSEEYGIRLIVALVNNWDYFGGMNQYVQWSPTATEHDHFYTDTYCKTWYKDYINYFLNRENTYKDGLKYKDDPTIIIWELANEAECKSDTSGDALYNWIEEMASYIKFIDENHLVATGEAGFYDRDGEVSWIYNGSIGTDYIRNSQCEYIDVCTFHLYPSVYWLTEEEAQIWIVEHIEDAHNVITKPVYLGEFGIKADRNLPHTFSQNTEGWGLDPNWANNAYQSGPVRDNSVSYDGDGSIYYEASFDSIHSTAGGDVEYEAYGDYTDYETISAWVYIPQGAPTNLKAELYAKDYQWRWADGNDVFLVPNSWVKVSITNDKIVNSGLDIAGITRLGIQVKRGSSDYSGRVYYDLVEGITASGEAPLDKRNRIYADWYNLLDANDADGVSLWILSGSGYPDYDNYTVYFEDTATSEVINIFSDIMRDKNRRIIVK